MRTSKLLLFLFGGFLALVFSATPLTAQKVDLALVLLIDDSGSIDNRESQMQLSGYAAAFRNPQVIEALTRGPNKSIAVSAVMFANRAQVMIPWTVLDGRQSAEAFAAKMQRLPRITGAATHIGKAIEFSIQHISRCPFQFFASTIDLSADGWDNEFAPVMDGAALITGILGAVTGISVPVPNLPDPVSSRRLSELRNYATSRGITINCIAIEDPRLRQYFSRYVMAGPSAFTMFAPNFRAFTDGIQRKLLREINDAVKLSTVRQNRTPEVRRAQPITSPQATPRATPRATARATPGTTPRATARTTPARATTDSVPGQAEAETEEPADATQDSALGTVEQTVEPVPLVVEVRPPVDRRFQLLVRDAINDFPLDEVRLEALPETEILAQEAPEGRPGLVLLDLRTPADRTPRLRVSAPLYLPKEVNLTQEMQEVTLERQPLRIVW